MSSSRVSQPFLFGDPLYSVYKDRDIIATHIFVMTIIEINMFAHITFFSNLKSSRDRKGYGSRLS